MTFRRDRVEKSVKIFKTHYTSIRLPGEAGGRVITILKGGPIATSNWRSKWIFGFLPAGEPSTRPRYRSWSRRGDNLSLFVAPTHSIVLKRLPAGHELATQPAEPA